MGVTQEGNIVMQRCIVCGKVKVNGVWVRSQTEIHSGFATVCPDCDNPKQERVDEIVAKEKGEDNFFGFGDSTE